MERREKTEFLLEQMRLLVIVARGKDAEATAAEGLGTGEAEWIKVRVGGRKVNEGFLKEKANEVILSMMQTSAANFCLGLETQVL